MCSAIPVPVVNCLFVASFENLNFGIPRASRFQKRHAGTDRCAVRNTNNNNISLRLCRVTQDNTDRFSWLSYSATSTIPKPNNTFSESSAFVEIFRTTPCSGPTLFFFLWSNGVNIDPGGAPSRVTYGRLSSCYVLPVSAVVPLFCVPAMMKLGKHDTSSS